MPANIAFIPNIIARFADYINSFGSSQAEINLNDATQQRPEKMTPMKGAEDQAIGYMEVPPGEAHLISMLTRQLGRQHDRPMKALDIGTFTGHSAMALAEGMQKGGKVYSFDYIDKYADMAHKYWKEAGVDERIQLDIAPAGQALQKLLDTGHAGTFDIAFIDADKEGYDDYYEKCLKLLRPGGMILLDNMLWSGNVADVKNNEPRTTALRDLNLKIAKDERVDYTLLDADDGIMLVEKCDPEHYRKIVHNPSRMDGAHSHTGHVDKTVNELNQMLKANAASR